MATQTALNATGASFTFELPLPPGRASAATSRPVALSSEDKAALDALNGYSTTAATVRLLSAAATTNATLVKATPGAIVGIQGHNAKASAVYLKIYNKETAPVVGTDVPIKTLHIPPSASFAFSFPNGIYGSAGLAFAITGAIADADTTALVAADILALNVDYV